MSLLRLFAIRIFCAFLRDICEFFTEMIDASAKLCYIAE